MTVPLSKADPINPYFILFEGMIYALFAGTVWQTIHQGRFAFIELGWMCLYGLLLEWLTIKVLRAYHYGQFLIMVDNIPLCIGLGWCVIIDSSMRFTDRFQLAPPIRPIVAALMGLSIDLALDVIAIRLGLWHWTGVQFDQQWFGVPWVNFGAWFMVIWSYSSFIGELRSWQGRRWREWLYPLVALMLSLLVLIVASAFYPEIAANIGSGSTAALLIIGSVVLIGFSRPRIRQGSPQDFIVILTPLAFHLFAIFAGINAGVFLRQPILAVIEFVIFTIGIGVHWLGHGHKWRASPNLTPPYLH